MSYHGLSNDLTEVSFSSIRSGTLEERDQWRVLQDWFASAVLEPLFHEWLQMALLSGANIDMDLHARIVGGENVDLMREAS